MAKYKSIELVVGGKKSQFILDAEFAPKGARNAREDARLTRNIQFSETRECLAAHLSEFDNAAFVSVPHKDVAGERIPDDLYNGQLLPQAMGDGVLIATGSGEKAGNYIRLSAGLAQRLARPWGERLPKFLQATGLLFSTMTNGSAERRTVRIILPGHPLDQGQEGNGVCPYSFSPTSTQIRAVLIGKAPWDSGEQLVLSGGENPGFVFKGIVSPSSRDGWIYLHHSQLKGVSDLPAYNGEELEIEVLILRNEGVTSEAIVGCDDDGNSVIRARKAWMSSEVSALVADSHAARRWAALRVRDEVGKLMSLFQDDHRVELLSRWGGLELDKDGELLPSRNAGVELLRSNVPWSIEVERALGRFAVPEVREIAHGLGIRASASLIVQNSRFGGTPISREEALTRLDAGKKVYVLYRGPVTGTQAVLFFSRNPYKKGIGLVVSPEAAALLDGDSDGDWGFLVSDQEAVGFLAQHLDAELSGTGKPEKERKAGAPITRQGILDFWRAMVGHQPVVGRSTILGWRLIRDGLKGDAVKALTVANAAPMLSKHRVRLSGEALADILHRLACEERMRTPVDDEGNPVISPLNWRDFKVFTKSLRVPRQIAGWARPTPESVIDEACNAASVAVEKWALAHDYSPLDLGEAARKNLAAQGMTIPGWAKREARKKNNLWAGWWKARMHHNKQGELVLNKNIDADPIYREMREWGATAEVQSLAAFLGLETRTMARKWAAVFDTHRGVEVLGLHPDVEKEVVARRLRAQK